MSDKTTKKMIQSYLQDATPTRFLSGFFRTPLENYHTSETVELDIERSDEDVAIVVTDLSTGNRGNAHDLYTNKEFKPPVYKEESPLNSFDLIKRVAGENPFVQPDFQRNATVKAMKAIRLMENKIRRSIELQASQVLQTGILDLKNSDGVSLYQLDFKPKSTHLPQVTVSWSDPAADPGADLQSLCNVIRVDGLTRADTAIMSEQSFRYFVRNVTVKEQLDNRRFEFGGMSPRLTGEGAIFQGTYWVGDYQLAIWTYPQYYKDPETGNKLRYIEDNKVIVLDSQARYDLTFGAIPRLASPEAAALPFLPGRIEGAAVGLDMTLNAYFTESRENLIVSAGTRPLCIPTAIDTYGCLTTVAP